MNDGLQEYIDHCECFIGKVNDKKYKNSKDNNALICHILMLEVFRLERIMFNSKNRILMKVG